MDATFDASEFRSDTFSIESAKRVGLINISPPPSPSFFYSCDAIEEQETSKMV